MRDVWVDTQTSLKYFKGMTLSKLGKNYMHDLLHDALTSRIKGTNRPFTHLLRMHTGEWVLVRENQLGIAYFLEKNIIQVVGICATIRESSGEKEIPLAFELANYRPCKLSVHKIGDKEIPYVKGGGSLFNFIEDYIDQTYQWYIDNDVERPADDITHAYDLDKNSTPTPQEAQEAPSEDESTSEVAEEIEDPFGALYRRDNSARRKQWGESMIRTSDDRLFTKGLEEAKKDDPVKFDYFEEKQLKLYLLQLADGNSSDEELNMIIRFCRCLDEKYTMIRRSPIGAIIAKTLGDEKGVVIYFNPDSKICIADNPSTAFKLKPELIRYTELMKH